MLSLATLNTGQIHVLCHLQSTCIALIANSCPVSVLFNAPDFESKTLAAASPHPVNT